MDMDEEDLRLTSVRVSALRDGLATKAITWPALGNAAALAYAAAQIVNKDTASSLLPNLVNCSAAFAAGLFLAFGAMYFIIWHASDSIEGIDSLVKIRRIEDPTERLVALNALPKIHMGVLNWAVGLVVLSLIAFAGGITFAIMTGAGYAAGSL